MVTKYTTTLKKDAVIVHCYKSDDAGLTMGILSGIINVVQQMLCNADCKKDGLNAPKAKALKGRDYRHCT